MFCIYSYENVSSLFRLRLVALLAGVIGVAYICTTDWAGPTLKYYACALRSVCVCASHIIRCCVSFC